MSESEKGLSYVPQIKAAYTELMAAQHSKLQIAIRLGGHINDAREALEDGTKSSHGKWMTYCKTYFPEISHRTINVYMSLAKHRDKFTEEANSQRAAKLVGEGDLSIREAIDAVNKADGGGINTPTEEATTRAAKAAATRATNKAAKEAEAETAKAATKSADLATVLSDKAADEILDTITDDDKKAELLKQQLKTAKPLRLAVILKDVWKIDDVQQLVSALTRLLTTTETKAPAKDLTIPKQLDRRPAQPAA
jgi:hypothetical protein